MSKDYPKQFEDYESALLHMLDDDSGLQKLDDLIIKFIQNYGHLGLKYEIICKEDVYYITIRKCNIQVTGTGRVVRVALLNAIDLFMEKL